MAWWQAVRNWGNPTRAWRRDHGRRLVLDLDAHRFCGVGIGDPIELLSFLGPAARWSFTLDFPNHGVAVNPAAGRVAEMTFFFGHPAELDFGTFSGTIVYRAQPLSLSCADTEETIARAFGPPYWRDVDSDEIIQFFELGPREWQIEFGLDGHLKCLGISEPLLANPRDRAAFGVTKPWPPD